jgi:hypothetical protein
MILENFDAFVERRIAMDFSVPATWFWEIWRSVAIVVAEFVAW